MASRMSKTMSGGGSKGRENYSTASVVIKAADMSMQLQEDAQSTAKEALEQFDLEKDVACYIKKEFDKKYGTTWHCVVGRSFGSYITHDADNFIYFYVGQVAILLFKSG